MINIAEIKDAHERIRPYIHCTPILESSQLNTLFGCEIYFKADNLQKVGAFKARGACNAVFSLGHDLLSRGVITHSSGNHGAALAWAARLRGLQCTVVMPKKCSQAKIDAVRSYGAKLVFCESNMEDREATVTSLISKSGAHLVHPYDEYNIIAGQGTAALELFSQIDNPADIIMAPVGGGGLLSGTALVARSNEINYSPLVIGAEPEGAKDAWKGFHRGERVTKFSPHTIADGLRATVGVRNFKIISDQVDDILLTSEERIVEAMKLIWSRLKVVVEPSAAVPLASIMEHPERFHGQRVAIILTGGNLDLDRLPW
jgi:threonine dehydratase